MSHNKRKTVAETSANVPETLKTRLQLQGELQRASPDAPRVYKGLTDVFVKTWKNEGIRGLQRGLGPAVRPIHCCGTAKADRTVRVSGEPRTRFFPETKELNRVDTAQRVASGYVMSTGRC